MGVTDYHSKNTEEMATVPLIAHKVIVAKHKQNEKRLTRALVVTIIASVIIHFVLH